MRTISTTIAALLVFSGHAAAEPGDVLWHFEIPSASTALHRPSIGADGTIYWCTDSLYAISPGGQELWSRPDTDSSAVGIGADGSLYVAGWRPPPNDHLPALRAFTSEGEHLWDFFDFGQIVGIVGGPNVGPDGNVYAVGSGGFNPPVGFGAFSLTPGGELRWHVDGFHHLMSGVVPSEVVFGNGNMYKAELVAPMPADELQSGIVGIGLDGEIAWRDSISGGGRQPCVSPNGNVHLSISPRTLRTYAPDGSVAWSYSGDYTPTGFGMPAVGPDGSVYVINGSIDVISLDASGDVRWIAENAVPRTAYGPEVSPDGSLLVFGTAACNGGACPGRVIALDTADGSVVFDTALPTVPGGVPTVTTQPRFSNDGSVVYIGAGAFTAFTHEYLFAVEVAASGSCPADFNGDGGLSVADFTAFRGAYLGGDMGADFSGDGSLDVGDFTAFRGAFLAGCP